MGTLCIQLRSGTMMNMDTNVAVKLARAAMDKGHKVKIFGYGEGITLIKEGQDPKRFPNVGKEVAKMAEEGLEVVVCETCCARAGRPPGRGDQEHQDREHHQRLLPHGVGVGPPGDHSEVMKWQKAC